MLAIGGQVLVQLSPARQHSDAHLVNIAGRQRMLSQKLTKSALALLVAQDTVAPSPGARQPSAVAAPPGALQAEP